MIVARVAGYALLLLASCTQHDQIISHAWQACLDRGGEPSLYLKEFSKPKTQAVKCI